MKAWRYWFTSNQVVAQCVNIQRLYSDVGDILCPAGKLKKLCICKIIDEGSF